MSKLLSEELASIDFQVGNPSYSFANHGSSCSSLTTVQSYFNRAVNAVKNPQTLLRSASSTAASAPSPASAVQQVRNLSRAQVVGGGVLLAEVLGFFTVGEIVGRWKLIGYHGETGHGHH